MWGSVVGLHHAGDFRIQVSSVEVGELVSLDHVFTSLYPSTGLILVRGRLLSWRQQWEMPSARSVDTPWKTISQHEELTFPSCSQAMHTCLVSRSKFFNRLSAEMTCQVPWSLHTPYETTIPRNNWPYSSPLTLFLPQHLISSMYTLRSSRCR